MKKILISCLFTVCCFFPSDFRYFIDSDESEIIWTGRKINGEHYGTINFKSGFVDIQNNKIVGGEFIIDMPSIKVVDMTPEYNLKLENHLKNTDFFLVDDFPTAKFKIIGPHKFFMIDTAGIKGELTIKNTTIKKIILANISVKDTIAEATGIINIDRTLFGITYGSGSFFDNLQDRAIDDNFTLEFKAIAKK